MTKLYATDHALDRAVERLGQQRKHAQNHLNGLMQTAKYIGDRTDSGGNIVAAYYHENSRTEIRTSLDGRKIVTCMRRLNPIMPDLPAEIADVIQRKAGALMRKYTKELRRLDRTIAEHELKMAQLKLNKLRVHNPQTKRAINESMALVGEMVRTLSEQRSELAEKKRGVEAHV